MIERFASLLELNILPITSDNGQSESCLTFPGEKSRRSANLSTYFAGKSNGMCVRSAVTEAGFVLVVQGGVAQNNVCNLPT